ncbi:MAG: hypothetical protein C0594_04800, partial [Marinilabiliales bacterium]
VIGAGPSGLVCTLKLLEQGYKVALIEKDKFPREKVCGDALGSDVLTQMEKLPEAVQERFNNEPNAYKINGTRLYAPNGKSIFVDYTPVSKKLNRPMGVVMPRKSFDLVLFDSLNKHENLSLYLETKVTDIVFGENDVRIIAGDKEIDAKMVCVANGDGSKFSERLVGVKKNAKHYCQAVRAYYEGVEGFHNKGFIDLYLFNELLPGYLWVFPMADGRSNVGLGIMKSKREKFNYNLSELLDNYIHENPLLASRFKNAKRVTPLKGAGIPLASKKYKLSGKRFLVLGDAGALVDPLLGEGISYAMKSGRIASEACHIALSKNDFSQGTLSYYDQEVNRILRKEFKSNYRIQKLIRKPGLFNFVANKAQQFGKQHYMVTHPHADKIIKRKLLNPLTYFKLVQRKFRR